MRLPDCSGSVTPTQQKHGEAPPEPTLGAPVTNKQSQHTGLDLIMTNPLENINGKRDKHFPLNWWAGIRSFK